MSLQSYSVISILPTVCSQAPTIISIKQNINNDEFYYQLLGFQKKDISKLLQHKNSLLQRSGLLYVLSVMQRVMKATIAAASAVGGVGGLGRTIKIERLVAAAVHKLLPDFQLLLNIRSKYVPLTQLCDTFFLSPFLSFL